MARGAAQARRKAAKTPTRRQAPARRQPSWEDQLFFTRLRRQAKWVFVVLAFVFAAGFVFFGVGSGSTGIGDLLKGNFNLFGNGGGSSQSSAVKKAVKDAKAHPKNPEAWNALATAYQSDGKLDDANRALEHVLKLRPNDADALQRVAGYYENKATVKQAEAQQLQSRAPVEFGSIVGVSPTSQVGQVLGQDQVSQQLSQKANAAYAEAATALRKDEGLYKRIVKLQPSDPNTQFHLAQIADFIGDTAVAIKAYKAVVRLAPNDSTATQAKQRLALLSLSTGGKK